ncbi:hypothetical protein LCGC14_2134290 [marine sediment metagenome]|uniref:Uncharacterized protein n=1 Tax=marine sediment metagenome TaxID=412755 RepID=A0A0F9E0G0_9ZZZZ
MQDSIAGILTKDMSVQERNYALGELASSALATFAMNVVHSYKDLSLTEFKNVDIAEAACEAIFHSVVRTVRLACVGDEGVRRYATMVDL